MLSLVYSLPLIVYDMTKFKDKDDAGYESVLGELRRWVEGLQPALGTAPTNIVHA